jgi:hypothetical protein
MNVPANSPSGAAYTNGVGSPLLGSPLAVMVEPVPALAANGLRGGVPRNDGSDGADSDGATDGTPPASPFTALRWYESVLELGAAYGDGVARWGSVIVARGCCCSGALVFSRRAFAAA